jgi:hypothetical protein
MQDSDDEEDETKGKKKPAPSGLTKEQALLLAKEYASNQLGIKNLTTLDEQKGNSKEEIEINDFSATIRSKMIQKDALFQLTDLLNVSIQCKGNYYPPGTHPPSNEKKLFLLVEGTQSGVEQAKQRILNLLAEYSREEGSIVGSKMPIGKYSVL